MSVATVVPDRVATKELPCFVLPHAMQVKGLEDGGMGAAFGIVEVSVIEQASLRHQHIISLAFWSALAHSGLVDRASDNAERPVVVSSTILF